MTDFEMRMEDLERRLQALEERTRRFDWSKEEYAVKKEAELVDSYGEHVNKSTAASILGVTRATVYAMLADGRLEGAFGGRHVSVRSIARFICSGKRKEKGAHDDEGA